MRILLVNDDGITAPGLALVENHVQALGHEVWVVAPFGQQSAKSRALTLYGEMRLHPQGDQRFALEGTPVDCVLFALGNVLSATPPDVVISGMNMGANLAEDVAYSGTCGAALEAASCGVPALALSQMRGDRGCDYELAAELLEAHFDAFLTATLNQSGVLNVNFPNFRIAEPVQVQVVPLGQRAFGTPMVQVGDNHGIGLYAYPSRVPEHPEHRSDDLEVVHDGHIAVTPLQPSYEDRAALGALKTALGTA